MSRVLKFRAWDGERMRTDFFQLCVYDDGCELWLYDESQDWPVMQFTGLTDSEGVEIYEGDVVHLAGYGDYVAEFPFLDLYDAYQHDDIGAIRGNIHEHPELQEGDR